MNNMDPHSIQFEHPFTNRECAMVEKMMLGSIDFYYSVNEGGWISRDHAMILVTDRFPYNGLLMKRWDVPPDIEKYWSDKVRKMWEKNNGSE